MHVVNVRNVHQALPEVMHLLRQFGKPQESRNGPVLRIMDPVTILYERPCERVIFWPERDANPFFHVLESLWMLAGRDDVAFPASIVKNMASFSDDGIRFHGAYGRRWRKWFSFEPPRAENSTDQLVLIADTLKENPNCRRQVLAMWDANADLGANTKDLPCNTHAYFSIDDTNRLNMTVCNRSNDAVWGALGANAVHFSILQEYLATRIGCEVGKYWQVTNNLHLYLNNHADLMETMAAKAFPSQQYKTGCPYEQNIVTTTPLIPGGDYAEFDKDIRMFLDEGHAPLGTSDWFVRKMASPMLAAIMAFKCLSISQNERLSVAQEVVNSMPSDNDWTMAAQEWLARRAKYTPPF